MITLNETSSQIFDKWYDQLILNTDKWNPKDQNMDMELVNHIYRVIIQNHDTERFYKEFIDLTKVQNKDGSWSNFSHEEVGAIRCTAFSTQMLVRANNDLPKRDTHIDEAIEKAVNWLVENQAKDGTWYDDKWGVYDAVSVNVGTLMFIQMLDSTPSSLKEITKEPWQKGMDWVIAKQQSYGGWEYKKMYDTPVCVTAHLLQKTLGYGEIGIEASRKAVKFLQDAQHPDGHYDNKNTDHTCDSIRALMLASELLNDFSSHNTIVKGYEWLIQNRNDDDGWGDYYGDPTDELMVTDGLDTILKYNKYIKTYNKSSNAK